MFYLHVSNKTENLLQHLAALIKVDPPETIFEKEHILIQSQGMERMISQYMADAFTSWCNFDFLLPLAFLQLIAKKLGLEIEQDCFERNILCWRIEGKLHEIDNEVYGGLQQYLSGSNTELKRYQLAAKLANVFDQYQLMRPQMLKGWQKNHLSTDEPAEVWQMHLWNRLTGDDSLGRHRGEQLQQVIARLHTKEPIDCFPHRISVFGLHIMPPLFLEYFKGVAKHCDVHLFLLNPCQHYWGDMHSRSGRSQIKAEDGADARAEEMTFTQSHSLLTTLGMQGRVFQEMLLENVTFEKEIASYEDPFSPENPKLLHRIQSDLLAGALQEDTADFADDQTVTIVSCHSRQRELAVLKDHIFNLLNEDHDLELRDIVIMAPDIQEYSAFIPTVFSDIQHSIADRSTQSRNSFIAVFTEFIKLCSSRFGWLEVLDLLLKKEVFPNFGLSSSDFERLQQWVISSGIRWGLSGKVRRSAGFDFNENSWRTGLDRLLMGYLIDSDDLVEGVLPYKDIEGGDARILGGLCQYITLIEEACDDFHGSYTLEQWSTLLLGYCAKLFGEGDDRDLLELCGNLRKLNDYGVYHQRRIDFSVIRKWFENAASESRSARGFLRGQLTFCSMLPMRSIPFKAVCLIGMNYGVFPKNDRHVTFDLMARQPRPGDRSLRSDDRYQFLEALLAARDSLYISYVGQSLQDNNEIPPSVVVTELLEILASGYSMKDIVVKHPLHPFSTRYFSKDSYRLYSYSEENFDIAQNLHHEFKPERDWWHGGMEVQKECVDLAEFMKFYRNPQLFFLENCLGVSPGKRVELPEDRELFVVEGLDSFLINQEILEKTLEDKDIGSYLMKLRQEGRWSLGVPGDLAYAKRSSEVMEFKGAIEELGMGQRVADVEIDLQIGGYRLLGTLANLYQGGVMITRYTTLKGKDLLNSWIHHLVALAQGGVEPVTKLMTKDRYVCFDKKEALQPDLETMIDHYIQGCIRPSKLYIEPAFHYCTQKMKPRAKVSPLHKAEQVYQKSLENGYEPAWSLMTRGVDLTILDPEFEKLCEQIMMPLWSVIDGR